MKTKRMLWALIILVVIMILLVWFIAIKKDMTVGQVVSETFSDVMIGQQEQLTGKALECKNEWKFYISDEIYGEICVELASDAGQSCTKPNDCESWVCVLRNLQTSEYSCYEEKELRGCVEAVLDGGVVTRLCG